MYKKFTKNDFIDKARLIHGNEYDYSEVEYVDSRHKVKIICPKHGAFMQRANHHLQGSKCPKCMAEKSKKEQQMSKEVFIETANKIHNNKYDYSKVNYENNKTKVCIICHQKDEFGEEHGEFWQTPTGHIANNEGCPKCGRQFMTEELFIKKAKKIHNDKYDYSKVNYNNMQTKVCIICPKHGEFWQKPHSHLEGYGCKKCATEKLAKKLIKNTDTFIAEAMSVHENKYDYSKTIYEGAHKKVCIICPEHGEFWQTPTGHVANREGCPECKVKKSKIEQEVEKILKDSEILYETQQKFEWLKNKKSLLLDFYLPQYNIGIECQGSQHFIPINYFGGLENFNEIKKRDIEKKNLCDKNGVKLFYVFDNRSKNIIDKDNNIYNSNVYSISSIKKVLCDLKNNKI